MAVSASRVLTLTYAANTSRLSKANEEAESSLGKLGKKFQALGKAAAVGVAAAGTALVAFGKKAVSAAAEAEAGQVRLATILRNTGLATEAQIKGLNAQAEALEKVGVASAGNITVLQGQLATFDLTADTIERLTPSIIDYVVAEKGATASASDYQAAANGLAQALQGNFASLTRTGFVLDDVTKELITNGTEAERAAALAEVLGSTYAGFNETARETAQGQLVALKNSFGSLTESIGFALLPAMQKLTDGAFRLVERLQELWEIHGPRIIEFAQEARIKFVEWFVELRERFEPRIRELIRQVRDFIETLREWWQRVSPGVLESFRTLREPIRNLFDAFRDTWNAVRDLFAALGEVFGRFSEGEQKGSGFETFIRVLVASVRLVVQAMEFFQRVIQQVLDALQRLVESRWFSAAIDGLGRIIDLWNRARGLSDTPVAPPIEEAPRPGPAPRGPIPGPGTAGDTTNNFYVDVPLGGDPAAVAREIERALAAERARAGDAASARNLLRGI